MHNEPFLRHVSSTFFTLYVIKFSANADQKFNISGRVYCISWHPSPAWSELLFSVSSVLQVVAEAGSVKTGSGLAETSAGPAAASGEQVGSHVLVAAAVEPKKCWKGNKKKQILAKTERKRQKSVEQREVSEWVIVSKKNKWWKQHKIKKRNRERDSIDRLLTFGKFQKMQTKSQDSQNWMWHGITFKMWLVLKIIPN